MIGVGEEDGGLYHLLQHPISVLPKHSTPDIVSSNFCANPVKNGL